MLKTFREGMDFGGKTVAVLGGAGLLGSAVVEGLSAFNAHSLIVDVDSKKGKALKERISKEGGNADFHLADCSKFEEVPKIIKEIEATHGQISGWSLCFYPRTNDWNNKLEDIPLKSWNTNVDQHMNAVCLFSSEIARRMSQRGGGSIVTIGSIYGLVAPNFKNYEGTDMTSPAAYSAIKGGIIAFSKYLASYYGSRNVRVNSVIPGGIFNDQPKSFIRNYSSQTCLGRLAQPEEVASAIIYLLSDASSYITGVSLPVDGGYLAL